MTVTTQPQFVHAYLIEGSNQQHTDQYVKVMVKSILCLQPSGLAVPCRQCDSCLKLEHGSHPDSIVLKPEGLSIKIEQIQQLQHQLSFRTENRTNKVYVIEQADKLTTQAANRLLKMLEEPLPGIYALLVTSNRHSILATIRSRLQLKQVGTGETMAELLEGDSFAELKPQMIQLFKQFVIHPQRALVVLHSILSNKGQQIPEPEVWLTAMHLWLKDWMLSQQAQWDQLYWKQEQSWFEQHSSDVSLETLIEKLSIVVEARRRIKSNVSLQLMLEQVIIRKKRGEPFFV